MYPRPFDYFSPRNLDEALECIQNAGPDSKILAGGQSLIPALKLKSISLKSVIDITGIKGLDYINREENVLKIGALTTTGSLERDPTVASSLPILKETASQIADPLVRNLGTIGGDLCHADSRNDLPAVMIALGASFVAACKGGKRSVGSDFFFLGASKTALRPDEILTEVDVPLRGEGGGSAYRKIKKDSGGFTIAGVACSLTVADDGAISACRIALTAVGPKALRAVKAEQAIMGKIPDASIMDEAAKLAVAASQPASDLSASEEYRRKVLDKLVKDAVEAAYKRAVMGNYES